MDRVSTGITSVDAVIAGVIPIVLHFLMPGMSVSGSLVIDVLFMAAIPIFRAKWMDFRYFLVMGGVNLYDRVRNKYETTVEFEKEVCLLVFDLLGSLRCIEGCPRKVCSFYVYPP